MTVTGKSPASEASHPNHRLWKLGCGVEGDLRGLGDAAKHAVPRVHGNGFLQVNLDKSGNRRLHIWGHPALPAQSVRTGIHDHTYGVASEVIVGRLINLSWGIRPCDDDGSARHRTHDVYEAHYHMRTSTVGLGDDLRLEVSYDSELHPNGRSVSAKISKTMSYGEGCSESNYLVPAGRFHSTATDGVAATVMTKITPAFRYNHARVLVPTGQKPDNNFSRHEHDPVVLLGIIGEVVPDWHELLERS